MANNPKASNEAVSAAADAIAALLNNGWLKIYDGAQPATANTGITTQVLLAELRYGATAFGPAVNGVATANAITQDSSNNATGTASWFRALKGDGTSPVFDGSVGTSGCDLNLNAVALAAGAATAVTSHTITVSKG